VDPDINKKVDRFDTSARHEQFSSPEIIQPTKSVRYPPNVRRAITTQAAPADTKITANLYDSDGNEITSGLGSGITVHCKIAGGGNLDSTLPILADNQDIDVYNEQGIWRCTTLFQHWPFCEE